MRKAGTVFAQALPRTVDPLAACIFGDLQHRGGFSVAVIEHLDKQEGSALFRAQAFKQGEKGEVEAFGALELRFG